MLWLIADPDLPEAGRLEAELADAGEDYFRLAPEETVEAGPVPEAVVACTTEPLTLETLTAAEQLVGAFENGANVLALAGAAPVLAELAGGRIEPAMAKLAFEEATLLDNGELDPVTGELPDSFTALYQRSYAPARPPGMERLASCAGNTFAETYLERSWAIWGWPWMTGELLEEHLERERFLAVMDEAGGLPTELKLRAERAGGDAAGLLEALVSAFLQECLGKAAD